MRSKIENPLVGDGRAGLPPGVRAQLHLAAEGWRDAPERPRPDRGVVAHWDSLIREWIADPTKPLLLRRSGGWKGSEQVHESGRTLVCADNAPAHWCFASALHGDRPTVPEMYEALVTGQLPVAFVSLSKEERGREPRFTGTMGRSARGGVLNDAVWKVCHVDAIGIRKKGAVVSLPLPALIAHCRGLLSPSNMFLVPNEYAGFGELPEVRAMFKQPPDSDRSPPPR